MGQAPSTSPIDLNQYTGRWYEIARYPNPFEKDCYTATADYIIEGQELIVINTCYQEDGSWHQNIGRAVPAPNGLVVSFNYALGQNEGRMIPSLPGDYRVLWTDYQNISFVGGGPFYWILSRKPVVDQMEQSAMIVKTRQLGYDPRCLIWNEPNLG
jgi:apolipoprotein D and lipocalin family protein